MRDGFGDGAFVHALFRESHEHLRGARAHLRVGAAALDRFLVCATAHRAFRCDHCDVTRLRGTACRLRARIDHADHVNAAQALANRRQAHRRRGVARDDQRLDAHACEFLSRLH